MHSKTSGRHRRVRARRGTVAACALLAAGLATSGLLAATNSLAGASTGSSPSHSTRPAGAIPGAPLRNPGGQQPALQASLPSGSQSVSTSGATTVPLVRVGTVNLSRPEAPVAPSKASATNTGTGHGYGASPLRFLRHPASATASPAAVPRTTRVTGFSGNLAKERGFDGVTAAINGGANSPDIGSVGDVSPPDQGLAVGPSPVGTVALEFVNDSLVIYSLKGTTLLGAMPAFQVFGLPASSFLSDPRAFWDPPTHHWFLTMFTIGTATLPSTQYIAVSVTGNPFGSYGVFAIDTTDSGNTGCPCFGDFDMIGADASGFYITTNEFPISGNGFNGTVMYAISKGQLIAAAEGGGSLPTVQRYAVPYASDPFAAYHLAPSTVTDGSVRPHTEYFVESNANLPNNAIAKNLEVFALLHTKLLNKGERPPLVMTTVHTESYTELPPLATQRSGPTPLGDSVGFSGTALLDTDFNAVQEVTYASGLLYAELTTGFAYGTGQNAGAAWFVLKPKPGSSSVSVSKVSNGYLETSQNLLYPDIGVNSSGMGYMTFAVSGPARYPSAAYVAFDGAEGPQGSVHIAAAGTAPLDTFDCYPSFGFSTGQCRFGDYSMAQEFKGKVYMATEYVAPRPRDPIANWATRVFWAPNP